MDGFFMSGFERMLPPLLASQADLSEASDFHTYTGVHSIFQES